MKFYVKDSIPGTYRPAKSDEIVQAAQAVVRSRFRPGRTIQSPEDSAELFRSEIGSLEYEVFSAAYLDNRHRLIAFDKVFRGTIDAASVFPREICRDALKHNAAAVVVGHNHISTILDPSTADERITRRLKAALELIDVRLLDHLVVSAENHVSLAARGLV